METGNDAGDPTSPLIEAVLKRVWVSNENTNGLLRQYLPRKLDLATHSKVELDQIAAELNGRPRETLNWHTPAEKMEALLR